MTGDWLTVSPKVLLARGALAVVFGLVAMVWPSVTLLALVLLWGGWALLDGLTTIGDAFTSGSFGQRLGSVALGIIAVLAGLIAFVRPGMAVVTITWVIGIWLIARGITEAIAAFNLERGSRWLVLLAAALDIALGAILFANPGSAALSLIYVIGLVAVAWGVVFVATSFAIRKEQDRAGQVHGEHAA